MARKQRGRHPKDDELFHPDLWGDLRRAASDLAWLKSRGYADTSSLKIVGDRYRLNARQRAAIARSSCSDSERASRNRRQVEPEEIRGKIVWIDGFNLIITVEAAIGGGVFLLGHDVTLKNLEPDSIAVSADSGILNDRKKWFGAARAIVSRLHPPPDFLIDFDPK